MIRRLIFLLLIVSGLPLMAQTGQSHQAQVSKYLELFNSAFNELDAYYVDTLDARKTIEHALEAMLGSLDPYTEYYAEENTNDFKQLTTGKYAGIGALVQYRPTLKRCIIAEPYAHTPAAESGLHAGDVLLAIDGRDYGDCTSQQSAAYSDSVSASLRGEPGTSFSLSVRRHGHAKPLTFRITRRTISLPTIEYDTVLCDSIGYVALSTYNESTSQDLRQAIVRLKKQGATRLLLDLRDNPGGLLSQAVKVVSLFVPRGKEVVRLKGRARKENVAYYTEDTPLDTTIPLVVLVNEQTASAAEITSGALQDYDRAVVVGRNTYGKGLVQEPRWLPYHAMMKVTSSKYYIPSGRCVQAYRYQNGLPVHLSDSAAAEFHTAAGRPVRDSGGIRPDIAIKADTLPTLVAHLQASDALIDYCNEFQQRHKTIAPAHTFRLSADDYAQFRQFLKDHGFTYNTQSHAALQNLRRIVEWEGYHDVAADGIDRLDSILSQNEDYDFVRLEKSVRRLVEESLVRRYYYQRGAAAYQVLKDNDVAEALKVLADDKQYRAILQPAPANR